jgi:ATP-binding cassette subfamily B protein
MENENRQSQKKEKPRYNLLQNVTWMIRMSKRADSPEVGFFVVLMGAVSAGVNIAGLLVTPMILKQVEDKAPLSKLLLVIAGYTLCLFVLNGAKSYFDTSLAWTRIHVRSTIGVLMHEKFCKTSYPNTENPDVLKRFHKACMTTWSNNAATEAVWHHMELFLEYVICFVVYLYFLSHTNYFLLGIITVTTVVEFFVSKKVDDWRYQHRDESSAASKRIEYITRKGESRTIGKDIRIFGMKDWMEDIYHASMQMALDLENKLNRRRILVDLLDVVLTVLRNGLAYYYLLNLTINENLPVSSFLLYFGAVGGFAKWINSILKELAKLNTESTELSVLREMLEMAESFRMEGGKPLPNSEDGKYELKL